MNSTVALLVFDAGLFTILVIMLGYHIRYTLKQRRKTEEIKKNLEQEHEKTKKFHIDLETIRRMTKG